jgi:cell division protease FtsH
MVFEEQSTGASNDIEQATGIARRMVTEFGMSRTLGPLAFGKKEEMVFLGREINESRNYSDEVALAIDREVRELIEEAHERARELLEANAEYLEAIAQLLISNETIEGEEMEALFDQPRPRPDLVGPPHGRPSGRMQQVRDSPGELPPSLQPPRERPAEPQGGFGGLRPNPAS